MKVIEINRETSKATVELFGKTRELKFITMKNGSGQELLMLFGIAVRYSHGNKIWSASVDYFPESGKFAQPYTPMDHRSRWAHVSIVGFYEDVPEQYRSKHR
jgi:hypothetical protein